MTYILSFIVAFGTAAIAGLVLVPMLRPVLGWFAACVAFVAVSVVLMLPMLLTSLCWLSGLFAIWHTAMVST